MSGAAEDPRLKFRFDHHRSCPVVHACQREIHLKLILKFGRRFRWNALPGKVKQDEGLLRPRTQPAKKSDAIVKASRIVLRMDYQLGLNGPDAKRFWPGQETGHHGLHVPVRDET